MNVRINEKIGAWLLDKEHTKAELAKLLGLSRPTLDGRLAGKSKWNWEDVVKVSEITGCTLNELAGIKD